ncbi:MAG: hypothetical protein WBU92_06610 [Candidatus Dormiibacterota bacterium]
MGTRSGSRSPRLLVGLLMLALIGVVALTVMAPTAAPEPNGLGVLPTTVTLLQRSGIAISGPSGAAAVSQRQAMAVARRQGGQDIPQSAFLAEASQPAGGILGTRPRLCWVVLLEAAPDHLGNLPAPGQISLYAVLVDARNGRFLEGVIAFQGPAHSGVGSE